MTARGEFEVRLTPQPADDSAAGTAVEGSGAYVAFELGSGPLKGKGGSFILQHKGTMQKNVPTMEVTVVPDSGTGELSGIAGTMRIIIEGGKHFYELACTFPGA